MNCDRCREQLPVGDGIDHQGQNLCLACYLQGAASSQPSAAEFYSIIYQDINLLNRSA